MFDCGLRRKRSESSRNFRKGMKCFLNRNNFTCKCLWEKELELGKRDGGLEWMRGVEDSCEGMGGWKKQRFGETRLISWRRGGFENIRTMIGACWRER